MKIQSSQNITSINSALGSDDQAPASPQLSVQCETLTNQRLG
jgi:hypothetical protein